MSGVHDVAMLVGDPGVGLLEMFLVDVQKKTFGIGEIGAKVDRNFYPQWMCFGVDIEILDQGVAFRKIVGRDPNGQAILPGTGCEI